MFDDLFPESAEVALDAQVKRPPEPPKQTQRFSAWGMTKAAPKGVAAGAAEGIGSTADILGAFGQVMAATDARPGGMFSVPQRSLSDLIVGGNEQDQAAKKLMRSGIDYNSEAGRSFRNVAADYTPDAATTHVAESAVFNLFRVGSKALTAAATMGNIPGAVIAGAEEGFTQSDQLGQQGVDLATRTKVGAVVAATNAVGFALPVAGKTWAQTGALALAGGPVSFVAQNAATREILQNADYSKLADQYDPFDPVGLALSTVLPLGFGALAMRGAKVKPTVEAKGPMPDGTPPPEPAPKATQPDDLVDAARVTLLRENMDTTNPVRGDMAAENAHATAYTKAIEQQAEGRPVSVMDVVPKIEPIAGKATDTPNFKAWFGESKVVDDAGAPLVVYHGTKTQFDSFDAESIGSNSGNKGYFGKGFYFSDSSDLASKYGDPKPMFISAKNPFVLSDENLKLALSLTGEVGEIPGARAADKLAFAVSGNEDVFTKNLLSLGHDSFVATYEIDGKTVREIVAFDPKQIKSAIGNSGKFDPNSASLTDNPIADWGAGLKKALDDMRAEFEKSKPKQALAPADAAQQATKRIANVQDAQAPAGTKAQATPDQAGANAAGNATHATGVPGTGAADVQANGVKALDSRLADIEARNPGAMDAMIATEFDDAGKPTNSVSVRDFLDQVKRDAMADEADAGLLEVAANCFLNGGL